MTTTADRGEPVLTDMPFAVEQLFYARTDKRGVSRAGNLVFQQISGFDWSQLIGAPHRLVRNNDTPRAVFRILWRTIQQELPVVAYVRNKTQDGRGYWVLALVMPIEDGFASIRLKPTSPLLATVKTLYARLAAAEVAGLSIEASEAQLLEELAKLGFPSYQKFMEHALITEFRAREMVIGQRLATYFADLDKLRASLDSTTALQGELLKGFDQLRDLPTNMRIIASRLEPSGGPISAISDIYNATLAELFREISVFAEGEHSISKMMNLSYERAVFLRLSSLLLTEMASQARTEDMAGSGIDIVAEAASFFTMGANWDALERTALAEAQQYASAMFRSSSDLRRSMLGLDTIRVMGRVESGRLGPEGSRIGATIDQLDTCHAAIIGQLQKIMDNSGIINSGVGRIRSQFVKHQAIAAG